MVATTSSTNSVQMALRFIRQTEASICHSRESSTMRLWLIPMKYVAIGVLGAIVLPRIEYQFLVSPAFALSTSSAQAAFPRRRPE